jgi:hypothetical protein
MKPILISLFMVLTLSLFASEASAMAADDELTGQRCRSSANYIDENMRDWNNFNTQFRRLETEAMSIQTRGLQRLSDAEFRRLYNRTFDTVRRVRSMKNTYRSPNSDLGRLFNSVRIVLDRCRNNHRYNRRSLQPFNSERSAVGHALDDLEEHMDELQTIFNRERERRDVYPNLQ